MKNKIKELRKKQKITQEELANTLGVTRQTINAIENNKYNPTLELAMKLARLLGIRVDELFILED
ncbi:helix-turn-helix transcriptional regulator [Metallumcola ferriviriculae]|uniref:Helix-turn-helix transcriptional regulator n=1 Tax=Metallumcola ferriviriculae TaxID=3039180 RepID=A0AAU0UMB2_9FIRM|nr:helix-turn-helix transcriptional regulator [Desulfitibacteraceae bacterium MK1]